MAEMNEVIYMVSDNAGSFVSRKTRSYAEAKTMVNTMIKDSKAWSDRWADHAPKVTWSSFTSRSGHLIERCSIVWWVDGRRLVDNVWIKRGYRYYGG